MSWDTVKLGKVATIERDQIDPRTLKSKMKYLGLEHIEAGGRILQARTVEKGELASAKFKFTRDHVLYGKLRPYLAKIAVPDFDGICSTDILPLMPGPKLDRQYLAHFLRQPKIVEYASSRSTGANLPRLSPKVLADFDIPLPGLPEQRRIASILDKADTIYRKRETVSRLANDFLRSSFMQNGLSSESVRRPLGDHLQFVTSGSRGWAKYYSASGSRFIRSLDVRMNYISDDDAVFVNAPSCTEADRSRVKAGDVLLTITGSRIGRVACVRDVDGEAYISQHVAIIRTTENLLPQFLSFYLSLPSGGQRQIEKAQYGQTKPGLNLDLIRMFKVPVPPINEQEQFVRLLEKVTGLLSRDRNRFDEASRLRNALSYRAFRGEL